ncbi:MAG: biosynthetic-type acetolactate synthase large subunit [Pseudomonadota bacterium]
MFEDHESLPAERPARAGDVMTGAEQVIQVLVEEGVERVFGYSGGAILPVFDALFRYNLDNATNAREGDALPMVVPANEQGAAFMAAGYARASGKVGVAMVTSGPGATNTVTPVRDCMADSVPIVLICGQVPTAAIGTDAFQEAPVHSIMGGACKHVFLVTDGDKLEATVRTAFEIARTGRPGPVVIDIPKDIQNATSEYVGAGRLPVPGYRQRMHTLRTNLLEVDEGAAFLRLLSEAERPLIYVGGGVINANAAQEVRAFADRFRIPVVTTLMGIGAVDTTEPLSLHMLGMHGTAFANYAVEDCDFLIALGARFDDRVAGVPKHFAPAARHIAHFDIDATEIGKVKAVDWHHVGELGQALRTVRRVADDTGVSTDFAAWHRHVGALRREHALNYKRDGERIQPQHIIEELNRHTAGEAIISTGVGQHQMWAAQYFDFKEPRLWLTSGSMGTMGFGLPAAIGAQFACPDRVVIDIDGDASIRMNFGELETVTTYGLTLKVVVLNNYGDGMVKQWQRQFFKGRLAASDKSLHKKNFVLAAQADGFAFAERLENKDDVPAVIERFLAFEGPAFLEVIIDDEASVYPMVGPGQSYASMITGPYIKARTPPSDEDVSETGMF